MGESRSSKYYNSGTPAANASRAKKNAYQAKYNKKKSSVKHRVECNAGRKKLGLKKGDKRDASHTKSGGIVAENRKANRGRNGSGGKKKLK
jgi:hypothetical protein